MRTIDGLEGYTINNYYIRRDCIELVGCGSITTINNGEGKGTNDFRAYEH